MSAPLTTFTSTDEGKQSIREQLQRLLKHPVFKNSKRCPIFLRYVVEQTLDGQPDQPVKERSIGVEVFGRAAGYDTNHDPIVRVTAGEVRKRIAQYYHESGHDDEVRIELQPGTYVPEFHFPATPAPPVVPLILDEPAKTKRVGFAFGTLFARRWMWACIALAVVMLLGLFAQRSKLGTSRSVTDEFWNPVVGAANPILLCIGQPPDGINLLGRTQESVDDYVRTTDHITLSDGAVLASLAGFLGKRKKPYRVQGSVSTSLTDLRQGPAVLIAGFDNAWTMRETSSLRFRFVRSAAKLHIFSIQDQQNSGHTWSVDFDSPYSRLTQDFAIVARFFNPNTDQMQVVAAGIGENGTMAAGEFITDPQFLKEIAARGPRDWGHRNLEAVIGTQVIDEKSGPPRVIAIHFW